MTGETKPSETGTAESGLSVSQISVEKSKEEEKTLTLLSALTELVVDSQEEKQVLGYGEGVKEKEVEEKDVSESLISINETKKVPRRKYQ